MWRLPPKNGEGKTRGSVAARARALARWARLRAVASAYWRGRPAGRLPVTKVLRDTCSVIDFSLGVPSRWAMLGLSYATDWPGRGPCGGGLAPPGRIFPLRHAPTWRRRTAGRVRSWPELLRRV